MEDYDIEEGYERGERTIKAMKNGQLVCQATVLGNGKGLSINVAKSPECREILKKALLD